MTIENAILRAEHVGIRELREHLSERLHERGPLVVTEHGTPKKILISYEDMLELVDILEELRDPEVLEAVREGRKAIQKGVRGIPVSRLFRKLRSSR